MEFENTHFYETGMSELKPVDNNIRRAARVLNAVNHPLRQKLIDMIRLNGEMSVTDIYVRMRMEQSVASQHLAILRRAGVVTTQREGKFIHYKIDEDRLQTILNCCTRLV